jgi:hypothetical protein
VNHAGADALADALCRCSLLLHQHVQMQCADAQHAVARGCSNSDEVPNKNVCVDRICCHSDAAKYAGANALADALCRCSFLLHMHVQMQCADAHLAAPLICCHSDDAKYAGADALADALCRCSLLLHLHVQMQCADAQHAVARCFFQ